MKTENNGQRNIATNRVSYDVHCTMYKRKSTVYLHKFDKNTMKD